MPSLKAYSFSSLFRKQILTYEFNKVTLCGNVALALTGPRNGGGGNGGGDEGDCGESGGEGNGGEEGDGISLVS